ncbi:MAG: hypothetical protein OEW62_04075 [Candidatus Bathyarchaeota archaeon]|nr:hypothetical protein [Candidatus Bathyarchaeota archaeon]MDH5745479.1 hypothetical protein [Candidatus Bathyarchaeota archaeon]
MTDAKGIVLVKDESGNEKIYTRYIYLRMVKSGRKLELIHEAKNMKELKRILRGY